MGRGARLLMWILGLPAYVALSSLLGATGGDPASLEEAVENATGLWSKSLEADVLFVGGSVITGTLAFGLARSGRAGFALVFGFLGTWLTYLASYSAILLAEGSNPGVLLATSPWSPFVLAFVGWMGLAFSTLSAPLAGLVSRRTTPA